MQAHTLRGHEMKNPPVDTARQACTYKRCMHGQLFLGPIGQTDAAAATRSTHAAATLGVVSGTLWVCCTLENVPPKKNEATKSLQPAMTSQRPGMVSQKPLLPTASKTAGISVAQATNLLRSRPVKHGVHTLKQCPPLKASLANQICGGQPGPTWRRRPTSGQLDAHAVRLEKSASTRALHVCDRDAGRRQNLSSTKGITKEQPAQAHTKHLPTEPAPQTPQPPYTPTNYIASRPGTARNTTFLIHASG